LPQVRVEPSASPKTIVYRTTRRPGAAERRAVPTGVLFVDPLWRVLLTFRPGVVIHPPYVPET